MTSIPSWFRRHFGGPRLPVIAAAAVIALLLALLMQSAPEDDEALPAVSETQGGMGLSAAGAAQAVYVCPMNCVSAMPKPGKCPVCGMELVALFDHAGLSGRSDATLDLSSEEARKAGIRILPVERRAVTATIRLYGKIEYDPVDQYRVTAFAPGIIDRIYVQRAGQTVRRGDPLFDLHSSELFFVEQDLFEALKAFPDAVDFRPSRGQTYQRMMRPARRSFDVMDEEGKVDASKKVALERIEQSKRKMRLLGLTDADIDNVMARGLPTGISTVTTPISGVVLEQAAFKGAYVNTGETIFVVANPRFLWARLDAYESDFAWLRIGQEAEFVTDAFPGKTFRGTVLYLDPFFDPVSRTFKVGVLYQEPQSQLKPNMLVRCVIHARMTAQGDAAGNGEQTAGSDPLVIPESAPLITGTRAIVYVHDPHRPGSFSARSVVLGPRAQGYYVVREGLSEGEQVVVSGNFKIDSAVQIQAKPSMMDHGEQTAAQSEGERPPTPAAKRDSGGQPSSNTVPVEHPSHEGHSSGMSGDPGMQSKHQ
ncbi:MAG: efflux RND transporter periplasmic adaptor subunit [Desulfofustis sp.]|nr:efflux RND transporter periplasmic adaptor subunit [Desulfofustis sp.]